MPAYFAFVSALQQSVREAPDERIHSLLRDAPPIAALIPELADRVALPGAPSGGGPEGERLRLFEAVSRFILGLAGANASPAALLTLDDLHWADSASLALLLHVARKLTGASVLVLGERIGLRTWIRPPHSAASSQPWPASAWVRL